MIDLEITNICKKADQINNLLLPIEENDRVTIVLDYLKLHNVRTEIFLDYVVRKERLNNEGPTEEDLHEYGDIER